MDLRTAVELLAQGPQATRAGDKARGVLLEVLDVLPKDEELAIWPAENSESGLWLERNLARLSRRLEHRMASKDETRANLATQEAGEFDGLRERVDMLERELKAQRRNVPGAGELTGLRERVANLEAEQGLVGWEPILDRIAALEAGLKELGQHPALGPVGA